MGNKQSKTASIAEARRRIKEVKSKGAEILVLSGIGLTGADLKVLIPQIRKLRKLKKLALGNNGLKELPNEIGSLTQLKELILFKNQLVTLPGSIEKLKNLEVLDATNNPLKKEEIVRLTGIFKGDVLRTNMAAYAKTRDHKKVLEAIYGATRGVEVATGLKALELGFFQIEGGAFKSTPEVFQEFLEKFPETDDYSQQLYYPAARHFIDNVLNTDIPEEERGIFVQQIATSLGDCPTPVKSFLVQAYIGQFLEKQEEIPDFLYAFIEREAVEEHILSQLAGVLRENELIEQVQGLSNSLFLEGAENREDNKVPITGERDRLPTKTDNVDLSFALIAEEAALAFVHLVCQANEKDEPIKQDGQYVLDMAKIRAITKPYLISRGILPLPEKYAQQFIEEISAGLPDKKDKTRLTEIQLQAANLQLLLESLKNSEMADFYENFVTEQTKQLAQTSSPDDLSAMTTALNTDNRSQLQKLSSPGGKKETKASMVRKHSM